MLCVQEFRQKLPSWGKQEEILELIRDNQVVVLSGETGCGKTTQVSLASLHLIASLDHWICRFDAYLILN